MTSHDMHDTGAAEGTQPGHAGDHSAGRHGSHSWMMIACCIPMLVIAVALVVAGIASPGFIVAAIACTVMMAFMMRGMDHGGGGRE